MENPREWEEIEMKDANFSVIRMKGGDFQEYKKHLGQYYKKCSGKKFSISNTRYLNTQISFQGKSQLYRLWEEKSSNPR